ncbi:MAG: Rieske 2Fe-2S domain-containing protein [Myxococcota bacterium]
MPEWRPDPVSAWYLVGGARGVRAGRLTPAVIPGRRLIVTRTADGPAAYDAACPHMGADLGAGWVDQGRIVCPLHGFGFGPDGACDRAGVDGLRRYPTAESCGAVFVHPAADPDDGPDGPPPDAPTWPDLVWRFVHTERVPVPWAAVMVNAFDLHHLQIVHRRALVEEPVFEQPGPDRLRMRYVTRVVGTGASDRVMAAVSRDRVSIALTCVGGPVMVVEADLGRIRTAAIAGLVPDGDGTTIHLAVGVPPGLARPLATWIARWLYLTFLRRDIPALAGARLDPRSTLPEDAPVQRLIAFMSTRTPCPP